MDQYADWFKKFVADKVLDAAEPKPQVPLVKSEPKAPQKPVVLPVVKPEDSDAEFQKRYDAELDAIVEMQMHPDLFDDSPGGWSNVQLVLDFIKAEHDGYPSRASVSDAISTLRRRGELLTLFRPEPAKPISPTPAKQPEPQAQAQVVQRQQALPPPDPDAGLPQLPQYIVRALGSNKLRTRADVKAIPSQLYSDLYRGRYGQEFRNRVNAILSMN